MIVEWNIIWPAVASPIPTPPHYWSIEATSAPSTVNCDSYSCSAVVVVANLVGPRTHVSNTLVVTAILEKQQWLAALPKYYGCSEIPGKCSWLEGQGVYILKTRGRQFLVETQFGLQVIFFSAVVCTRSLIMTCFLIRKSYRRSWFWCGAGRQLAWGQPGQ